MEGARGRVAPSGGVCSFCPVAESATQSSRAALYAWTFRVAALVCLVATYQAAVSEFDRRWMLAAAISAAIVAFAPLPWTVEPPAPRPLAWPPAYLRTGFIPAWAAMTLAGVLKLFGAHARVVIVVWTIGLLWLLLSAWRASRRDTDTKWPRRAVLLAGLLVLLVAGGLRFWDLGSIPRNVHCDEGTVNLLAQAFYQDPTLDWFSPPVQGSYAIMSLFYALAGAGTLLFGFNLVGARFMAALMGTLSPLLVFDGLRRISTLRLALVGALLVATNHTHLAFSRIASGYIQTGFVVSVLFWGLCRVWTRPTHLNATLLGAAIVLGMQTYPASLVSGPMLVAVLVLLFLLHPQHRWALRTTMLSGGLSAIAVGAPFLVMLMTRGSDLLGRSREVNIFLAPHIMPNLMKHEYHTDSVLVVVAHQILNAMLGFHKLMNGEPQYSGESPMTESLSAALLIPGAVIMLRRFRHPLVIPAFVFTCGYLVLGLGLQYAPGYNRTTGALPLGMVVAAVGLVSCVEVLWAGRARWLQIPVVLLLLFGVTRSAWSNVEIFFNSKGGVVSGDADSESGWIARELPADYQVHLVDWGDPGPEGLQLISAGLPVTYDRFHDPVMYAEAVQLSGKDVFMLYHPELGSLDVLRARFPDGRLETRRRHPFFNPIYMLFVERPELRSSPFVGNSLTCEMEGAVS